MNLEIDDIEKIRSLVTWKKEKPEEWTEFLKEIKLIVKDLMKVEQEISDEL